MPTSDIYTGSIPSVGVTLATVSASPIAALVTGANVRAFVVGIRVGIGATSVASGNVLFQLFRLTNTPTSTNTGGFSNDPNAPANGSATEQFLYANSGGTWTSTAPTGTTTLLWEQQLPNSTGSSWEEFPPLGYEYVISVSSGVALWVTCSSASSQTYTAEIVWSH